MSTALKTPFRIDNNRVGVTLDPTVQVKQKIVDVLVTDVYERTGRPEYGGGLNAALFENLDTLEQADFKLDLVTKLTQSITGISVLNLGWETEDSYATINIVYRMPLSAPEQFTFRLAIPGELTEETPLT